MKDGKSRLFLFFESEQIIGRHIEITSQFIQSSGGRLLFASLPIAYRRIAEIEHFGKRTLSYTPFGAQLFQSFRKNFSVEFYHIFIIIKTLDNIRIANYN